MNEINNLNSHNDLHETLVPQVIAADCEEAIEYVGSNGRFQKFAFFLLAICYTCTGAFITNSFIFLEFDPQISCQNDKTATFNCTRPEACKAENNYTATFHFYEDRTYSWTNDFRLECDENYVIGLFGTLFFIGNLISTFTTSTLSDYIGRAKLIKYSMYARSLVLFIFIFTTDKYVTMVFVLLIGLLNPMHSTIPYILISEYLSYRERDSYMTYMFVTESFSGIFCTLFFLLIQNWRLYLILNLVYGLVFVILSFRLYESPRFLYSNKRYAEASEIYQLIGQSNGKNKVNIKFAKEIEEEKKERKISEEEDIKVEKKENALLINENRDSLLDDSTDNDYSKTEAKKKVKEKEKPDQPSGYSSLFKIPRLRAAIIILPLIWLIDAFAFFMINFMIKYLEGGIYLNNTIIFISEVISYALSNKIMEKTGKRNAMVIGFVVSGCAFLFYMFFHDGIFYIYIMIFFSKFGASIVINVSSMYTNESFPTNLRGRATAICSFVGKFGGILAPSLVETSIFKIMPAISGTLCFGASILLLPLENKKFGSRIEDSTEEIAI